MVSVGFSISTREQRQEELEGRCCQWRHIGGSSAGPGSGNFQIEHSSQSPVQDTRSFMNAAFRIQLHLVRVHPAQVAQVGQDGQKGLSLSEQKARRGAGQGDISDIMIQCSPPSTIRVHLETFILHLLCNPDVRDASARLSLE